MRRWKQSKTVPKTVNVLFTANVEQSYRFESILIRTLECRIAVEFQREGESPVDQALVPTRVEVIQDHTEETFPTG